MLVHADNSVGAAGASHDRDEYPRISQEAQGMAPSKLEASHYLGLPGPMNLMV